MNFIDLLDKHASAIFGGIGAIFGFFSSYFFKKIDRKYDISKEEAKEYFKQQREVLNKALQLISEYEISKETRFDFYEDDYGVPIAEVTKEDIYTQYFLKIFEYLNINRLYLEEDSIKKLDVLKKYYYAHILDIKVIISKNQDEKDISKELNEKKVILVKETEEKFNRLIDQIKYRDALIFQEKVK